MIETPQQMAARADRVLAKCRERGQATLADVANLRNGIHELAEEYESILEVAADLNVAAAGLHDEFGILDHGGGLRSATTEPLPLIAWNAALGVELRAKGVHDPGGRRPATLMRRKASDWEEIPADVTPADIFPGYTSPRKADA
jgi:hypothetical protein